jgi:hypothetical protein
MRLFSILVSALILTVAAFPKIHQNALKHPKSIKMLTVGPESVRTAFHDFVLDSSDDTLDLWATLTKTIVVE